jgi:hypothetical protein
MAATNRAKRRITQRERNEAIGCAKRVSPHLRSPKKSVSAIQWKLEKDDDSLFLHRGTRPTRADMRGSCGLRSCPYEALYGAWHL